MDDCDGDVMDVKGTNYVTWKTFLAASCLSVEAGAGCCGTMSHGAGGLLSHSKQTAHAAAPPDEDRIIGFLVPASSKVLS